MYALKRKKIKKCNKKTGRNGPVFSFGLRVDGSWLVAVVFSIRRRGHFFVFDEISIETCERRKARFKANRHHRKVGRNQQFFRVLQTHRVDVLLDGHPHFSMKIFAQIRGRALGVFRDFPKRQRAGVVPVDINQSVL